jgi:polyhydroxybutyrate depolymerase
VQLLPLLIVLHGSGSDGAEIAGLLEIDALADRVGVVVAYPDGVRGRFFGRTSDWNAGDCCGYASRHGVDDVGMLRALIDELQARLPIDRQRVYVAGFSDGGRMAYRAACELSDRVAAIGVVAGSLRVADCRPAYPVSLVAIHGTLDDEVPYDEKLPDGGDSAAIARNHHLPPSLRFWGALSGCSSYAQYALSAHVTMGTFGGCRGNEVMLYSIVGGAHGWPHAASAVGSAAAPMESLAGSNVVLYFLLRHRRELSTSLPRE